MPRTAGKYRYRLTIEKYNATGNVWATYGYAWARIQQNGGDWYTEDDKTRATREYTVNTPYNPSLTIGVTGYRFLWTVQSANRYLYIHTITSDEATMNEESIFECTERIGDDGS